LEDERDNCCRASVTLLRLYLNVQLNVLGRGAFYLLPEPVEGSIVLSQNFILRQAQAIKFLCFYTNKKHRAQGSAFLISY
jgi:hypothetical protein